MALSADVIRSYDLGDINTFGVLATSQIYKGAAVGLSSGYARGLVAGDLFAGFALENVLGNATNGGKNIQVQSSGKLQLSVTSLAITDIDKTVYASADGTFLLTQGSNTPIGTVYRFISSGVGIVKFDAQGVGNASIIALTDSSGGASADGTIGAVTAPTALTDNGGGTADATVASQAAPTTITDSTGLSATHDDTLAATAAITTITDSSGLSGTHDDTLAATAALTTITDNSGDSATHDDTVADGSTIGAALTDSTTGTAGDTLAATAGTNTLIIPCTLPAGTGAADVITSYTLGYKFKILGWSFTTAVAGVGGGASRVFNMEIDAVDVGTVVSTATLTEASTSAVGEQTAGTAVSGANTGTAANSFSIEVAAGGTAFTAGSGFFTVLVQNMDTADAVASEAAKINTLRTDNLVQNQNDSDLSQKVIELVTRDQIHAQNVSDLGQKIIELVTRDQVHAQNVSDLGQKVIELVTLAGTAQNNLKELTTRQGENRTAIVALTDAVKELSTKVNEIINSL